MRLLTSSIPEAIRTVLATLWLFRSEGTNVSTSDSVRICFTHKRMSVRGGVEKEINNVMSSGLRLQILILEFLHRTRNPDYLVTYVGTLNLL